MKLTIVIRSPEWSHIRDCLRRFIEAYPEFNLATIELRVEGAEG